MFHRHLSLFLAFALGCGATPDDPLDGELEAISAEPALANALLESSEADAAATDAPAPAVITSPDPGAPLPVDPLERELVRRLHGKLTLSE